MPQKLPEKLSENLPEIPDELRALMAEVGPVWMPPGHVKLMTDKFTDLHRTVPRADGLEIRRDMAYGAHERHKLDVYLPGDGKTRRAALLFVHGGAFLDGDRNRTGEIYSNVLRYFGRNGVVGINIGYRLAGDAKYPGATEDIAATVTWVRERADVLGIDRDRIFLMGHSAGAAHAGS